MCLDKNLWPSAVRKIWNTNQKHILGGPNGASKEDPSNKVVLWNELILLVL